MGRDGVSAPRSRKQYKLVRTLYDDDMMDSRFHSVAYRKKVRRRACQTGSRTHQCWISREVLSNASFLPKCGSSSSVSRTSKV